MKRLFDTVVSAAGLVFRPHTCGPRCSRPRVLSRSGDLPEPAPRTRRSAIRDVEVPDYVRRYAGLAQSGWVDVQRRTRCAGHVNRRVAAPHQPRRATAIVERAARRHEPRRPETGSRRPARFYDAADRQRFNVRPGITGLAQVSGRNRLTWKERRTINLEYVGSQSLVLDVRILWRTLASLMHSRNVFITPGTDRNDEAPGG